MDRVPDRSLTRPAPTGGNSLRAAVLRGLGHVFWSAADGAYVASNAADLSFKRLARGTRAFVSDIPGSLGMGALRAAAFTVERRGPLTALAVVIAAAGVGWNATAPAAVPGRPAVRGATPIKFVTDKLNIETPRPRRPAPPAPSDLQHELSRLAAQYDEPVGVAVADVTDGWVASVDGQLSFPQQSVSKLWVAITAMEKVDQGMMRLDQGVLLTDADRSVFFQPITYNIDDDGYQTDVEELLRRALVTSDNAANDKLMGMVGGAPAVQDMIRRKALDGVRLAEDEKHLQALQKGVRNLVGQMA
ncbi:MAG TPA: serine hydrolase, partial [Phenylobacterium sp.]|nr:serine hydrolase [Phenylobacterium sp.]